MRVHGDGFVPYHVEVGVARGALGRVHETVSGWKASFRATREPRFPEPLLGTLGRMPGVTHVVREGAQSSVLIPLRMVRAVADVRCTVSTVLGSGPIADAIEGDLARYGVDPTDIHRLADADSPLELSFRDPDGAHRSTILYPAPRRRYARPVPLPEEIPDALIANRHNATLAALAARVRAHGGRVSLRPRALGRHDRVEDYLAALGNVDQLVLSSRHGVARRFARHVGVRPPRGWPDDVATDDDESLTALARHLLDAMPAGATIALVRHRRGDVVFCRSDEPAVTVPVPDGYGLDSRAARLQGALLAETLRAGPAAGTLERDRSTRERLCRALVQSAYAGTETRPWRYPSPPGTLGSSDTRPGAPTRERAR